MTSLARTVGSRRLDRVYIDSPCAHSQRKLYTAAGHRHVRHCLVRGGPRVARVADMSEVTAGDTVEKTPLHPVESVRPAPLSALLNSSRRPEHGHHMGLGVTGEVFSWSTHNRQWPSLRLRRKIRRNERNPLSAVACPLSGEIMHAGSLESRESTQSCVCAHATRHARARNARRADGSRHTRRVTFHKLSRYTALPYRYAL